MSIAEKIATLHSLSTAELAAEYELLCGKKPRYRNPVWMRKRIAYQAQIAAYGGLSGPARAELKRLAADVELPKAATRGHVGDDTVENVQKPKKSSDAPRPGTVLQREWHDQQIRVAVLDDGFEWNGERYGSLSAVARAVTGARWNGKLFFGLVGRSKS